MGKGSDATLLQHVSELAAMHALLLEHPAPRFHLYCTHTTAPWDALEDATAVSRPKLTRTLNLAKAQKKGVPSGVKLPNSPIINEYARLDATENHFPNTPILLQSAAQSLNVALAGVLVDKEKRAETQLRDALPSFRVFCGDFRFPMVRYRACDTPWLFTVAPLSFSLSKTSGDLNADALKVIGEHVCKVLVASTQPGAVTVFCPSADDNTRAAFWNAAVDAFGSLPLEFLALDAGNKKHLAAIMSTDAKVSQRILQEITQGIENVRPF
jgi:hypothetical protein